jgi:N-acetylglucosaminyldiphosphoundecaprenol N-acetyl-beta-D-mannosaminyltransferase
MLKDYNIRKCNILGCPINAIGNSDATSILFDWLITGNGRYICLANVHMLIEGCRNKQFREEVMANADLILPDGMPLVWILRLLVDKSQSRIAGVDLIHNLLNNCASEELRVFILGSDALTLNRARDKIKRDFSGIHLVGALPMPYRPVSEIENSLILKRISECNANLVFVSLGCPKQEIWMAKNSWKTNTVMIGVGGALPVLAGIHKRAPGWMRNCGLEWLFRLIQEPTRLWRRYFLTIPFFLLIVPFDVGFQMLKKRKDDSVKIGE